MAKKRISLNKLKNLIKKVDKEHLKENGEICPKCRNKNPAKKDCLECKGLGRITIIDV